RNLSEGFEQIIDFLNASYVKYALTVNPTVYTLCIKQFWAITKVKNVNGEAQIQAPIDKKKVIIIEASIRRDLRLEDEGGVDCLSNEVIFEQLTLMVLDLEKAKTAQAVEISSLKKRVKKLERKKKSRTLGLKRLRKVGSAAKVESLTKASLCDQEDASKKGRMIDNIDQDSAKVDEKKVSTANPVTTVGEEVTTASIKVTTAATTLQISKDELTLARTLIEIKATKPKAIRTAATIVTAAGIRLKVKGIVMQEPSETPLPKPMISSQKPSQAKDKGKEKMVEPKRPLKRKDQIMMDAEVAKNLEAQMQAELEEEKKLVRLKEEETYIALTES
nr:hypothetical protein [Tanacetum cinerariifolium]